VSGPKILVVGGARSGKSRHAQALVEAAATVRTYLATGEARDDEMADRIRRHRDDRDASWTTIEEPRDIARHLDRSGAVLVDCLTLWLSNVMEAREDIEEDVAALVDAVARAPGPLVLVANEVGLGVVPLNPLARRFRDEAGRLAQRVGAVCDRVVLTVAGRAIDLPPATSSVPRRTARRWSADEALLPRLRAAMPTRDSTAAEAARCALDGRADLRLRDLAASVVGITGLPLPPHPPRALVVDAASPALAARAGLEALEALCVGLSAADRWIDEGVDLLALVGAQGDETLHHALAGVLLGAAVRRVPVLIQGPAAAAEVASTLVPGAEYALLADPHPEGTGAAAAVPLVAAALAALHDTGA